MTYDLIILGAGAAGLTASIYASRYKLKHLVFGENIGGQIAEAHLIENYPGFKSISGADLAQKFFAQAQSYGVEIVPEGVGLIGVSNASYVSDISNVSNTEGQKAEGGNPPLYEVMTKSGKKYQTRSLILAMGARHRTLNVPGEEKFLGRGVSYCATCDAPLFKDKKVAVVGGGDSALTAAVLLADYARKVYLVHRGDTYRGEPVWVEKMRAKKVTELMSNEVVRVLGRGGMVEASAATRLLQARQSADRASSLKEGVTGGRGEKVDGTTRFEAALASPPSASSSASDVVGGIELKNEWQGNKMLVVEGLFVEIGLLPAASLANNLGVAVAEDGGLKVDPSGRTNVPGVFAAGDLCRIPGAVALRQIITSAAQGALAAAAAYEYLHRKPAASSWGEWKS